MFANKLTVDSYVVMSLCLNCTPIDYRLTCSAVSSAGMTVCCTCCFYVFDSYKLCIVVVPRINVIVDHSFNRHLSAERAFAVNKFNLTLYYSVINSNYRTVSRCILCFGSNRLTGYMIYSIPRPETDRSAEYSGCRSVYLITVSFKIYGQNAFNLIKSISCAKSVSNYHTLRLPSVCILKKDRNRELINISYISNVNICIVYRIVLRFSTRIIVTAKNNRRITRNSEVSDCNCGITECILYLKLNGMRTRNKINFFTCKILSGNSYVRKLITVNVNFSSCIVKLNVIGNNRRECHAITVNCSSIV